MELGIDGPGLLTESHDEMDAITSAVVGRFYETGEFLPMGISSEAQLIVPRIRPLHFDPAPIIFLAGKTGAGKSVVARYLALFYGFRWVKTRELIRQILIEDLRSIMPERMYSKDINPTTITDADLREFGILVLEKYKQEPLRKLLQEIIINSNEPMVVDAIRDVADIAFSWKDRRLYIWYVDSSEPIITNRLFEKAKMPSFKDRPSKCAIDQKVSVFRERCDCLLSNAETLENLRRRIDDALFQIISFSNEMRKAPDHVASNEHDRGLQ